MIEVRKHIAIAKIVDPSAVKTRCTAEGGESHNGAIYCEIPELGFFEPDLIYCRYGLAIPYFKIQAGWKLLVEATVNEDERWFYTGIADCGTANIVPADADQMLLQFASQIIYASTAGVLYLSSKTASQPFVNGTNLKTWTDNVDATLKKLLDWSLTGVAASNSPVDLGGIAPLVVLPADYPVFPANALSTKIKGE